MFAVSAPCCNVWEMAAEELDHSVLANVSLPTRYLDGNAWKVCDR